jgi:hypothetical protein
MITIDSERKSLNNIVVNIGYNDINDYFNKNKTDRKISSKDFNTYIVVLGEIYFLFKNKLSGNDELEMPNCMQLYFQ